MTLERCCSLFILQSGPRTHARPSSGSAPRAAAWQPWRTAPRRCSRKGPRTATACDPASEIKRREADTQKALRSIHQQQATP
eukprot:2368626-Rhodomonas_salina.1